MYQRLRGPAHIIAHIKANSPAVSTYETIYQQEVDDHMDNPGSVPVPVPNEYYIYEFYWPELTELGGARSAYI